MEDQVRDAALIQRHLSLAGYEVISERVETAETMRAALQTQEWDVILCDYSMPHFNALAALAVLKEMLLDIPFIIISGTIGEEVAVQAMLYGAHDYLMKNNLVRLVPAIERELEEAKNRRARWQAEELLRENEDRYRDLVENSFDLICTHDLKGRILSVNQMAAKVLGYPKDALLGRDIREALLPEYRHEFDDYIDKIQQTRFAQGMMTVRTSSGEKRLWEYTNTLRTEGVTVPIVRGVARDVTERMRAEENLRKAEEKYRSIFENAVEGIFQSTLDGRFISVNPAMARILGYESAEELIKHRTNIGEQHYVDSNSRPKLEQMLAKYGVVVGFECEIYRKDMSKIWTVENIRAVSDEKGRIVLYEGSLEDITERKRIEQMQLRRTANIALRGDIISALAETDSSLQEILKRCTEAMVQHLGAAFARIWTFSQEENVLELQASAGLYTHIDGLHARIPVGAYKIGLIAQARQPHITNDVRNDPRVSDKEWAEREGIIAFAGYPLVVENRLIGVIATFARQKLADDTLDALASVADIISQSIYHKHTEKALRQSEEQLRQSQKLESIGQLAGGIAHDFNNLLTVIGGYSELSLRRLQSEDPLHRNIEEIKKAGDRAASLTRQLLAFSRKQVLQPKVLNINSVVSDFEKMLQRLIGEDIDLRTMLAPEVGSIKADPGQIEQVIMNLVVNARDAMPLGGKLTIETNNIYLDENYAKQHVSVIPGSYVMLAVSDTGSGMDEETQKRMFEPFFTTKGLGKGTGLGLSTVYGIIKQSGGNIWVYSELGHGTSLKIYLPRIDEDAHDYEQISVATENIQGTETILLAEDEEILRNLAREVLESYGYKILDAANGGSALLICERHPEPIHLLITDVIMPEMSGRELADRLSNLRPEMKVLYMSGYTDNAIVHHGVLDEGTNFIQKPFTPDALTQKVREVLDEQ